MNRIDSDAGRVVIIRAVRVFQRFGPKTFIRPLELPSKEVRPLIIQK